jgi:hypothetical protein
VLIVVAGDAATSDAGTELSDIIASTLRIAVLLRIRKSAHSLPQQASYVIGGEAPEMAETPELTEEEADD